MTHVRTSPFYPQSNGKLERWHHSLKSEAVRLQSLSGRDQAERVIAEYIRYYSKRLNFDRLDGGSVKRCVRPAYVRRAIWPG